MEVKSVSKTSHTPVLSQILDSGVKVMNKQRSNVVMVPTQMLKSFSFEFSNSLLTRVFPDERIRCVG